MTPVKFNEKEIREINEIIAEISKVIKPKSEIGARSKATLAGLLAGAKKPSYFKCKREYSDAIVNHFTKEKGVTKSRFSTTAQDTVFVI